MENKRNTNNQGGSPHASLLIDWNVFRNTLIDWITSMSHIGFTLMDQSGYLTLKDKFTLHQILMAYFIHTNKEKRLEVLNRAHLQMENLERDVENLSIYGTSAMSNL